MKKIHAHPLGRQLWAVLLAAALLLSPTAPVTAAEPTNGPTPALAADVNEGAPSSAPNQLAAIGSTLFFAADDDEYGQELWRISPPYTQAFRVSDINPDDGSARPEYITAVGDTLFFRADDGTHGYELWRSQPPYTSAEMVTDLNPGAEGSLPHELTPVGSALFFAANDGSSGTELWKTESPFTSAERVADIAVGPPGSNPDELTRTGWILLFSADDTQGRELWKCTPPYINTCEMVSDVNSVGNANVKELTFVKDILFFTANDGEYGQELWMSESPYNVLTTRAVNDFSTRSYNTYPSDLHAIGDTLFYTASIGFIGMEPWKVVPPYGKTQMTRVADINSTSFFWGSFPYGKMSIGETLFFIANDNKYGFELWKSVPPYDDDSTKRISGIRAGMGTGDIQELTAAGSVLFFTADDGKHGRELWRSVPPYTDVELVKDLNGGAASSNPEALTALGDSLFFAANDGRKGIELWKVSNSFSLPASGFAPARFTPRAGQPAALQQVDDLVLEIPKLGQTLPIVGVPYAQDQWDLTWLGSQAGYLEGSAYPTWNGNTVLTAHAALSNGLDGPFARLSELRWGDSIVIHANGQRFLYEVRTVEQVDPQDASVFEHEELDWLTLLTCAQYDPATDRYLTRLAVRAVRVGLQ